MTSIAIVYHSGFGHTAAVAQAVADGANEVAGTTTHLVPVEDFEAKQALLDGADAIIFGSPTYMGSASAGFKTFMDATAKIWYGRGWQDKLAAGFTVSASQSGDKLATLQQLAVFAAQHGMVWVGLGLLPGNNNSKGSVDDLNRLGSFLGAMAQANADEAAELTPPQSDRKTAAHLGRRVAEAAQRWAR
ncbi:flavodoxin family protein [Magnetospirillum sulfuroxidans]|uniref:Flavodoxin family protein n=1 Tax=Magnetospirillum sulfuroxidans TaxID=611300 RepID=A0ABS5IEM0_9PROT|nr:flavodoxin family protein [Magnetospirillum sulfuroxidans]MBR9972845.1 flavodoxin family protein [Magnetospirillum sulfuroxidans]